MANAHLYGGDPDKIWASPVERVLTMYDFYSFSNEYQSTYIDLNNKVEK